MPSFLKRSTRTFANQARKLPGFSILDFLHGYVYARWPYFYIKTALGGTFVSRIGSLFAKLLMSKNRGNTESRISERFASGYHGKVLTTRSAARLIRVGAEIDLRGLERIIPYPLARDIVLKNPDFIVALECPCRSARTAPCLPLDVCLIIGEPFAPFILEHHPGRSRRISPDEAVRILHAEHQRGHVHHAFFKDAMLGRFYAVCNCCSCCCGAMQAFRNGVPMLAESGYVCRWSGDDCSGCGKCAQICPFQALAWKDGEVTVREDACMGCGVCVDACPSGALTLVRDPSRSLPLEMEGLSSLGQGK
ncbi:MAG: 4Fe-4S binding protein [Desulfovibrionales bacterium]